MADIEARIRVADDMSPTLNKIVKGVNNVISKLNAVVTFGNRVTQSFNSASQAESNLTRNVQLTGNQIARINLLSKQIEEIENKRLAKQAEILNLSKLDADTKGRAKVVLDQQHKIQQQIAQAEANQLHVIASVLEEERQLTNMRKSGKYAIEQIEKKEAYINKLKESEKTISLSLLELNNKRASCEERVKNILAGDTSLLKQIEALTLSNNTALAKEEAKRQEILNILQKAFNLEDKKIKAELNALSKKREAERKAIEQKEREERKAIEKIERQKAKLAAQEAKLAAQQAQNAERIAQKNINAWRRVFAERQRLESKAAQVSSDLWGKAKMIGGAYLGTQGALSVLGTADQLASNEARLQLMVKEGESADQLSDKIYAAAMRSRSGYMEMADSVAKVGIQAGNLFDNSDQMVRFMETFNKMAVISKSTTQQTNSAMTQLIQALSFGQLRGDELKSILENMPMVAHAIADELTRVGGFGELPEKLRHIAADGKVTADEIRALGYEGQISAETVVNAMLNGSKKIDAMAENMTWTWGQVWTVFRNHALNAFTPVLQGISKIIQTERFQRFATWVGNVVNRMATGIQNLWVPVGNVLAVIFDLIAGIGSVISSCWGVISPILSAVIAGMLAYKTALIAVAAWQGICATITAALNLAKVIGVFVTKGITSATARYAKMQLGLNSALWACPLMWIIMLVIALIAIFYIVIAVINYFADTSISATGLICGAFAWLAATVWNIIVAVWSGIAQFLDTVINIVIDIIEWFINAFGNGFDSFGAAVANLLGKIISWFLSLGQVVTKIIDAIFGTNWTAGLEALKSNVLKWGDSETKVTLKRDYVSRNASLDRVSATDWYNAGYDFGDGVSKIFDKDPAKEAEDQENDLKKALEGGFADPNADAKGNALRNIDKNTGETAKNTGQKNEEDTKYLREIAERESINRFALTDLNVTMTNNNSVSSNYDVEKIGRKLWGALCESAMDSVPFIY